jgi:ribosomal-protein-alanine N-acetyltransferase
MQTDWAVEPLTSAAELDAILAIERASFTNPWTREMYLSEFRNRDVSFLFVARNAERCPIGFCAFWRVQDELHINNLAVLPEYRRAGVASALLERVLAEGRRHKAVLITLEVRASNEAARRLYDRFGFTLAGVRPEYYSEPTEDALILWRKEPPVPAR